MKLLSNPLIPAAAAIGMLALSSAGASAAVACSGDTCWHTPRAYDYPPGAHVVMHGDDWHWGPGEHYACREHEGRGYWRGDRWIEW